MTLKQNTSTNELRNLIIELKLSSIDNEDIYVDKLNELLTNVFELENRKDLSEIIISEIELLRQKGVKEYLSNRSDLKDLDYINKSFKEKTKYWSGRLHQQMRWQVESGLDPYAIYKPDWYQSTKEFEPDFDKIMDEVFSKYWGTGADWSKEEYLKRISSK
ncbi:hypothetical protein [Aquimarina algiphila]|uniref:hypothetical protein n=1 Tax=Aquimarina algiphila TaxID=2047982 RepID=UPI00232E8A24|nr:hypothetical protein [Aquimarina algiphila]